MADTSDDEPISNRLRAGEPTTKKQRTEPTPTAKRYDAIVRHRMRNQPEVRPHKQEAEEQATERRRLKKEAIYQIDDTQSSSKKGDLPTKPDTSKVTEPVEEQSPTPIKNSTIGAPSNLRNNRESKMIITEKWNSSKLHGSLMVCGVPLTTTSAVEAYYPTLITCRIMHITTRPKSLLVFISNQTTKLPIRIPQSMIVRPISKTTLSTMYCSSRSTVFKFFSKAKISCHT